MTKITKLVWAFKTFWEFKADVKNKLNLKMFNVLETNFETKPLDSFLSLTLPPPSLSTNRASFYTKEYTMTQESKSLKYRGSPQATKDDLCLSLHCCSTSGSWGIAGDFPCLSLDCTILKSRFDCYLGSFCFCFFWPETHLDFVQHHLHQNINPLGSSILCSWV